MINAPACLDCGLILDSRRSYCNLCIRGHVVPVLRDIFKGAVHIQELTNKLYERFGGNGPNTPVVQAIEWAVQHGKALRSGIIVYLPAGSMPAHSDDCACGDCSMDRWAASGRTLD